MVDETGEKLRDLKRHGSKSKKKLHSDLDIQIELNKQLEDSLEKLREENQMLGQRYSSYKEKVEHQKGEFMDTIKKLKEENKEKVESDKSELLDTIKRLKRKNKEIEDSDKGQLLDAIKNLKEKNTNLMQNLRIQMTSTNKIDAIRQKLSEKCKDLTKQKEELINENEEFVITINQLREQLDNRKNSDISGDAMSPDHMQLEKTKGTFSEKEDTQDGMVSKKISRFSFFVLIQIHQFNFLY